MNRREFLALTGAAALAGCSTEDSAPVALTPQVVNAGPAANFATDGVYDQFQNRGFLIVRNGEQLSAMSSFCTHRKCKLTAEPDHSFYCKCHGSTFAPDGKVTHGPARRDLPVFLASVNDQQELIITIQ